MLTNHQISAFPTELQQSLPLRDLQIVVFYTAEAISLDPPDP